MTDLLDLAARCEAAEGPDRELDCAIDALLGWRQMPNPTHAGGLIDMMIGPDGKTERRTVPAYTASLDAAMTLVPEGSDDWAIADLLQAAIQRWKTEAWRERKADADRRDLARFVCAAALRACTRSC